jgi:hypothetical protein
MIYFKYLRGASFGSIFRSEYKIKILSSEIYQGYSTCTQPSDQNLQLLLHAVVAWLLGALLCRPSAHSSNNKQLELVNATMSVNWQSEEDVARQFENERQGQRVLHDNPILQPGRGVELAVPFVDTQSLDRGVRNVNFTVKESQLSFCPHVVSKVIDQDQPVYNLTLLDRAGGATVVGCAVSLAVALYKLKPFQTYMCSIIC